MSTEAVPPWVARYIGIPYAECSPTGQGGDCWGLLRLVWAKELGFELPAYDGPPWRFSGSVAREVARSARSLAEQFEPIPAGCERLGDGVLIRILGHPLHAGLVVAPGFMLHVEDGQTSCLARYNSREWSSRISSFYRRTA